MTDAVLRAVQGLEGTEAALDIGAGDEVEGEEVRVGAGTDSLGSRFALVDADIVLRWRVKPGALIEFLSFMSDSRVKRSSRDMREHALESIAMREVSQFLSKEPLGDVLSPKGRSLLTRLQDLVQQAYDEQNTGVELVSLVIPSLQPSSDAAASFEDMSIESENARKIIEEAKRTVAVTMATLVGDSESADEISDLIIGLRGIEAEHGVDSKEARSRRAVIERKLIEGRAAAASLISAARAKRWKIITDAQETASEVLGQAAAFHAAPELYRQRTIMDVLATTLNTVRMKYVLGPSPQQVNVHIHMREPDVGFNLEQVIERKDDGS
jgi:regulator of protease activity HflC (stomatin/prohibitin superfamily)